MEVKAGKKLQESTVYMIDSYTGFKNGFLKKLNDMRKCLLILSVKQIIRKLRIQVKDKLQITSCIQDRQKKVKEGDNKLRG